MDLLSWLVSEKILAWNRLNLANFVTFKVFVTLAYFTILSLMSDALPSSHGAFLARFRSIEHGIQLWILRSASMLFLDFQLGFIEDH